MRFYQEVWGIIWEFNSFGEWISFVLGRICGCIVFVFLLFIVYLFLPDWLQETITSFIHIFI